MSTLLLARNVKPGNVYGILDVFGEPDKDKQLLICLAACPRAATSIVITWLNSDMSITTFAYGIDSSLTLRSIR